MINTTDDNFSLVIRGAFRMTMENGTVLRFEGFIFQDDEGNAVLDA